MRRPLHLLSALLCCVLALAGCSSSSTGPTGGLLVTSVFPDTGSSFGGDTLTITGREFKAPLTVLVGGNPATNIVVTSQTTATFTTPAHASGPADVSVALGTGTPAVLKGAFRYVAPQVVNSAPRIDSLTIRGRRSQQPANYGNIGEAIDFTASVSNDTAPGTLSYRWTTSGGSVSGSGAQVSFVASTAQVVAVTLTVVEEYAVPDANGLPQNRQHVVTAQGTAYIHDENAEVSAMAKDFLERFSQSSIPPLEVMHNFKDNCGAGGTGRQDELAQVTANRRNFLHTAWTVGTPRTTVQFNGTSPFRGRRADAWSSAEVFWRSQCLRQDTSIGCATVGQTGDVRGTDWLTAVYDTPTHRWWLCDSDLEGRDSLAGFPTYFR